MTLVLIELFIALWPISVNRFWVREGGLTLGVSCILSHVWLCFNILALGLTEDVPQVSAVPFGACRLWLVHIEYSSLLLSLILQCDIRQ
jgi:hypothetical protein